MNYGIQNRRLCLTCLLPHPPPHTPPLPQGVNYGIQNGANLSRAKVLFFKHNNLQVGAGALGGCAYSGWVGGAYSGWVCRLRTRFNAPVSLSLSAVHTHLSCPAVGQLAGSHEACLPNNGPARLLFRTWSGC